MEGDIITTQDLFTFQFEGEAEDGTDPGQLQAFSGCGRSSLRKPPISVSSASSWRSWDDDCRRSFLQGPEILMLRRPDRRRPAGRHHRPALAGGQRTQALPAPDRPGQGRAQARPLEARSPMVSARKRRTSESDIAFFDQPDQRSALPRREELRARLAAPVWRSRSASTSRISAVLRRRRLRPAAAAPAFVPLIAAAFHRRCSGPSDCPTSSSAS